jgi:hypothetical protein
MRTLIPVVLVVAAGVALAADANATGAGDGRASSGTLDLQMRLPGGEVYTEGSVTHVRLVTASGRILVDGEREVKPLLARRLAPGRYRLSTYQRGCSGTCETLDPPSARCSRSIAIHAGTTLALRLVLVYDRPHHRAVCTLIAPGSRNTTRHGAFEGMIGVMEVRPASIRLRRASLELGVIRESDSVALYTTTATRLYRRTTPLAIPLAAGTYRLLAAVRACTSDPGRCTDRVARVCERRVHVLPGQSALTRLRLHYAGKQDLGAPQCRLGT